MMRLLKTMLFCSVLVFLVSADEFYKIEYAGNLAIFLCWFTAITCFIVAFVADRESLFKDRKSVSWISCFAFYATTLFIITVGWTTTGTFMIIGSILVWAKRKTYEDELKAEEEASGS